MIGPENAAKLSIKDYLNFISEIIPLIQPILQYPLLILAFAILMVLDDLRQHLQPIRVLFKFGIIQSFDLVLEVNFSQLGRNSHSDREGLLSIRVL